jgi:peptidoglycan/xylan/chitin deacetylase (PgdA/CDA1 family)
MAALLTRAISKGRRTLANRFRRRDLRVQTPVPLISFTFDDAPSSAFDVGRRILEENNGRGTYFVSLGLMDQVTEIGEIAGLDRLQAAQRAGHELGCHTFDHVDAWHVSRERYIASVDANRKALEQHLPASRFRSFAYPKSGAKLAVKADLEQRFLCCRGGGQGINSGVVDRNLLNACFLDSKGGIEMSFVRDLIAQNARSRGWLIFAAHEIADSGSQFRITPAFFETVVREAAASGAELLPVGAACERLMGAEAGSSK